MRQAKENDIKVDVPEYGSFTFARRRKEDVYKIRSRYNVLTEGNYNPNGAVADLGALALVTLQTLMVSAPEGFALDDLDPLMDDDFEKKLFAIFGALRVREAAFNPKKKAAPAAVAPVAEPLDAAEPAEAAQEAPAQVADTQAAEQSPQATLID
ncbi:hypothetical protein GNZ12_24235 [Paraburkholderia sp. 1N]|uniref:Phage tail assembly protein n=1 Tax=Paraburkholderia solitsugae TaxID=2675748 RepID=A0ABX2BWU2_9BURK|nr:hypothetical protein [Paraburkholderia solitsugae]NPT44363.1 hypothetical protein [Paraburkholderia solitsugae]